MTTLSRADLVELDRTDPLRHFRDRFLIPDGIAYFDGNSLGAMPKAVPERMRQVVEQEWGVDLIRSWRINGWLELPARIGDKIGTLISAAPGETIVGDSTSVNLFQVLAAALKLRAGRTAILTEAGNFPTDRYIAEGLAALLGGGYNVRAVPTASLEESIADDVAVVMLTHVDYRTGRMWEMDRIGARARAAGALTVWDLSHSAGAVPVDLTAAGADFAVGCGYKYLNGGPGAPAYLFMAQRHQEATALPLTGWLGHTRPFAFEDAYRPAQGIRKARVGTPPILSLAALEIGVDLVAEATVAALREKSTRQTQIFATLMEQRAATFGFRIVTPADPARRGSQISVTHDSAWPIVQALAARGVIGDFRAPDILRFGIASLYTRYVDLWEAVTHISDVMTHRAWDRPEFHAPSDGAT